MHYKSMTYGGTVLVQEDPQLQKHHHRAQNPAEKPRPQAIWFGATGIERREKRIRKTSQIMKTSSILLAALLLSSSAMAQGNAQGPLPPGKPAGVKQASGSDDEVPWILVTIVGTVALGVLVLKPFSSNTPAAATTTP